MQKVKWIEKIDENLYESYLDTHGIPDPDLLDAYKRRAASVQFSVVAVGLYRILFYGYSLAGFTKQELEKAIEQYNSRDRRFGGIKEEQDV